VCVCFPSNFVYINPVHISLFCFHSSVYFFSFSSPP
jgi:hypothetical protein